MTPRRSIIILAAMGLVATGCGGGDKDGESGSVSAKDRVVACLERQPEATKSDCEQWEEDGQLDDDGTHRGHESMG